MVVRHGFKSQEVWILVSKSYIQVQQNLLSIYYVPGTGLGAFHMSNYFYIYIYVCMCVCINLYVK